MAQTAKTETSEHSEVTDNQSFAVKEAHRKTMRENLAAVFENPNELPNNLFGLENNSEKRIENALDTEGSDSIKNFQLDIKNDHLETADSAETGELKKKKKKKVMHELAARSIEKDNELASETLADLHAFQGNVDKAVEMYRRLALAFPEKSDYFATKIKKLT